MTAGACEVRPAHIRRGAKPARAHIVGRRPPVCRRNAFEMASGRDTWCFIGTGSVLLESWIPLDGVTPLSLLVGAELQLGVGDGPID